MIRWQLLFAIGLLFVSACGPPSTSVPTRTAVSTPPTTPAPAPTASAAPIEPMPSITPSPSPVSETPTPLQPTATPSAAVWQTHSSQGFELEYPGDWAFFGPDGIECAALYHFYPSSLKLVSFSACWQDAVGGNRLTFAEMYERFREAFIEDALISPKTINEIQVEVIQYRSSKSNGIYMLIAPQGTVALWQRESTGWAFVDGENQYQENQLFDRILASFKFHEEQ